MINILDHPVVFSQPRRLTESAWTEHIPFAFTIMDIHRPRIFVELGTHTGTSFCAFCQAVRDLKLSTTCYAVDTWKGDEHAGFYGDDVFDELQAYNSDNYSDFSHLMRMTFDEASLKFGDGTIDLLHIDGYHTYDAVRRDFDIWFPKLSQRSVVLLHDTLVRDEEFGVDRFIKYLRSDYPIFEFTHGHGLAVVAIGSMLKSEPLFDLFKSDQLETFVIQSLFSSLGSKISNEFETARLLAERNKKIEHLRRQRTTCVYTIILLIAACSLMSLFILNTHAWFK